MRYSFVEQLTMIRFIGEIAVEVSLTEEFCRKHPVFPLSLIKPYHQTGEDLFPSRNKSHAPQDIVEVEGSPASVKKIRLNGKDHTQYFVRIKNKTAEKDKWLAEDAIPDGDLHLRKFRVFGRAEHSHQC
ncbi:hypothetical protein O181_080746 [Austropuccinia psidii MF-1]|uniref:Chromo domain-containing protein n=1 Tax=Austropuccinia psidii MF-1 TaxID=1389203 RepID=A0A9Q3IF89_9BASI|nr:hypothetical protein [Austropuccinia psidii MF-1]